MTDSDKCPVCGGCCRVEKKYYQKSRNLYCPSCDTKFTWEIYDELLKDFKKAHEIAIEGREEIKLLEASLHNNIAGFELKLEHKDKEIALLKGEICVNFAYCGTTEKENHNLEPVSWIYIATENVVRGHPCPDIKVKRPRVYKKGVWCEVGGKRFYSRSKWERNYARYLEWLKSKGEIADWYYEIKTFWFHKIKRGVRSYKPDFAVSTFFASDDEYHEVKGHMDAKSKTKLKRMAKYYPDVTVIVIDKPRMAAIAKWKKLIPGWED